MVERLIKSDAIRLIRENMNDIMMYFKDYYKYTFTLKGENENIVLSLSMGGREDIYRIKITDQPILLANLLSNEFGIRTPEDIRSAMAFGRYAESFEYFNIRVTDKRTERTFDAHGRL